MMGFPILEKAKRSALGLRSPHIFISLDFPRNTPKTINRPLKEIIKE
jgi:hypothetical protein